MIITDDLFFRRKAFISETAVFKIVKSRIDKVDSPKLMDKYTASLTSKLN